jgi:hypothetical protein
LLNNPDIITLVICKSEVTSILFKTNRSPGYVDEKLDKQMNVNFSPKTVILSLNIEKGETKSSKESR